MSDAAPRKFIVERPETQSLDEVIKRTVSKCLLCKGQHSLQKCPAFRRLHPYRRLGAVKRLKCCVNCLAQSHFSKNCRNRERCMECLGKHHTMLHFRGRDRNKSNTTNKGVVQRKDNNKSSTRSQAHQCSCKRPNRTNNNNVVATPNTAGATIVINVLSK